MICFSILIYAICLLAVIANESKSGYFFTYQSLPNLVLLKMFKSVNGGEYLSWYFYILRVILYKGMTILIIFTEQMGMFANVVHSILNELAFAVELDLDSRMCT